MPLSATSIRMQVSTRPRQAAECSLDVAAVVRKFRVVEINQERLLHILSSRPKRIPLPPRIFWIAVS